MTVFILIKGEDFKISLTSQLNIVFVSKVQTTFKEIDNLAEDLK